MVCDHAAQVEATGEHTLYSEQIIFRGGWWGS